MRLISISTHAHLKNKEAPLRHYRQNIHQLFTKIQSASPTPYNAHSTLPYETNTLIILIGSSKGLCGNFNTSLFNFFENYMNEHPLAKTSVITIGKRALTYANEHRLGTVLASPNKLTATTLVPIAQTITQVINDAEKPFSSVIVVSNVLKSFFNQKPQVYTLLPFSQESSSLPEAQENSLEEYIWEQPADEILEILAHQCMNANLQHLLFQSLIAEHAARFLSMDSSTRNAQNLLDQTKLDYNKLRQAKVTKELAELM